MIMTKIIDTALFIAISLIFTGRATAQEIVYADTISMDINELEEIVVEAQNQKADTNRLSFIPTSSQKNASRDAYDLLSHLSIPLITVDPMDDAVSTVSGGDVAIYINSLPASGEELRSIRPEDVLRVDYMMYPSDPRFGGMPHVINYITRQEDWGGYTRLKSVSRALGDVGENATVFSKFVYKKMAYDIYAGYNYNNTHHSGTVAKEAYSFTGNDDKRYSLTREQTVEKGGHRSWGIPVAFRAIYSKDGLQLSNTVSFSFDDTPEMYETGNLSLYPYSDINHRYSQRESRTGRSIAWNGFYYFMLPKGYDLTIAGEFMYGHSNNKYLYQTDIAGSTDIDNRSKENAYLYSVGMFGRKKFGENSYLLATIGIRGVHSDVKYNIPESAENNVYQNQWRASIGYNGTFADQFHLHADAGASMDNIEAENNKKTIWNPRGLLEFTWTPSMKHWASFWGSYKSISASSSALATSIIQRNEFMYVTGNPQLKSFTELDLNIAYAFLLSNNFTLGAGANLTMDFNCPIETYRDLHNGEGLLRTVENDGNFTKMRLWARATYIPVKGLKLELEEVWDGYMRTGVARRSTYPSDTRLYATYYIGKFFVSVSGGLKKCKIDNLQSLYEETPAWYMFRAGWGNSTWNIQLQAKNIFSSSWEAAKSNLSRELYSMEAITLGGSNHRQLQLSVSYTIGYGKKIERSNEIDGVKTMESDFLR